MLVIPQYGWQILHISTTESTFEGSFVQPVHLNSTGRLPLSYFSR